MCITFLAINHHPKYKFVLLFNRDEFLHRKTYPIGFHYSKEDNLKNILFYPLDCISGGTFLCLNVKNGNFGCLLNNNFKHHPYNPYVKFKRADIAIDFCKLDEDDQAAFEDFFEKLNLNKMDYNGFNFLCGNMKKEETFYFTNNEGNKLNEEGEWKLTRPIKISENIIGLSNSFSFIENDTTIYNKKVEYGKKQFEHILNKVYETEEDFIQDLFKMMEDDTKLLEKHFELEIGKEKLDLTKNFNLKNYLVSSIFVNDKVEEFHFEYGTRHTLIITLDDEDKLKVHEHCDEIIEKNNSDLYVNNNSDNTLNNNTLNNYNNINCNNCLCSEEKKVFTLEKRERSKMKLHEFKII